MMVPQFSEAQIIRMKKAYYSGVSTYDLAERFGICGKQVIQVVRGQNPLIYDPGDVIESVSHIEETKKRRIKSCQLHFMDLVRAYRPDVIRKHKEIQTSRRQALVAKINIEANKQNVIEEKSINTDENPPIHFRRSMRIFAAGLEYFGITAEGMTGLSRTAEYTRARHILMFVIYDECGNKESTPSIGRMFNRDHSTVVNAIHKVRKLLSQGCKDTSATVAILRGVK